MLKVISYSLFGDDPKYTIGAIKNAQLAKQLMPDWQVWIYIGTNVPQWCLDELQTMDNVTIKYCDLKHPIPQTVYRFLAFETADVVICRDLDDRLSYRGLVATNEWIESDLDFHIIKDHPTAHRTLVLAGMWGGKGKALRNIRSLIEEYYSKPRMIERNSDQEFLDEMVYYPIAIYSTLYHSEHYSQRILGDSKVYKFSTPDNFPHNHIGMALDENDCFVYENNHNQYIKDF